MFIQPVAVALFFTCVRQEVKRSRRGSLAPVCDPMIEFGPFASRAGVLSATRESTRRGASGLIQQEGVKD